MNESLFKVAVLMILASIVFMNFSTTLMVGYAFPDIPDRNIKVFNQYRGIGGLLFVLGIALGFFSLIVDKALFMINKKI